MRTRKKVERTRNQRRGFTEEYRAEGIYEVQRMLFPYIEGVYNRQSLHSSLGYTASAEKEAMEEATQNVAQEAVPQVRASAD